MDKNFKLRLADMVLDFVSQHQEDKINVPRQIGTLNKKQGYNGFKSMEVGTPVFDLGDKYMVMMESMDGKRNAEATYYKKSLAPVIDFTDKVEQLKQSFGGLPDTPILTPEDLRRENMYDDDGR